jgi:hypothetical protein
MLPSVEINDRLFFSAQYNLHRQRLALSVKKADSNDASANAIILNFPLRLSGKTAAKKANAGGQEKPIHGETSTIVRGCSPVGRV